MKVNTDEHEFDFRIFMNANQLCLNEETRRKIERFLECAPFVSNFRFAILLMTDIEARL